MAQKVNVSLVDDLDGSAAQESVTFGIDGALYEIDLSRANAGALRDALAPYVAAGRKAAKSAKKASARRTGRSTSRAGSAAGAGSPSAIRVWGRENGWAVNERGRISADLAAAYRRAH